MTASAPTPLLAGNYTFESIYGALRAQARQYLRGEQNGYSLSPTELVHEAWISLARSRKLNVNDSSHYVRLVSRVMKNLLVDH
ncbi:MAG: ECF-type sigma factor, partial [Bryobacteraceae bacterium]